jgi:hypothetical protein
VVYYYKSRNHYIYDTKTSTSTTTQHYISEAMLNILAMMLKVEMSSDISHSSQTLIKIWLHNSKLQLSTMYGEWGGGSAVT